MRIFELSVFRVLRTFASINGMQSKREITLVGKVVFRYAEILKSVIKSENLPKSVNPQIC